MYRVSLGQAREFMRDLKGAIYNGDCAHADSGIMSVALIAEYLKISEERASLYLWACANYGITERQGGGWVV